MGKLVAVLIFVVSVLSYGFYHASTHGSLNVSLDGVSKKQNAGQRITADLAFLDSDQQPPATAKVDEQFGVARLIHPLVGDCQEAERKATVSAEGRTQWQNCFEQQSTRARFVVVGRE